MLLFYIDVIAGNKKLSLHWNTQNVVVYTKKHKVWAANSTCTFDLNRILFENWKVYRKYYNFVENQCETYCV